MPLSDVQRHRIGVGTLFGVGTLLLLVPLLDVTTTYLSPNGVVPSMIENAFPTFLVLCIFGAAWYLYRGGLSGSDTLRVAGWTVAGLAVGAVIVVAVVGMQTMTQSELKPYLIAGNLLMVLAGAGTVVGFTDARTQRKRRELAAERNRFSALYENASDCVLELETNGGASVVDRNRTYERVVTDPDADPFDLVATTGEGRFDGETVAAHLSEGREYRAEVSLPTGHGDTHYLAQTIRVDDERAFLVLTDISAQKRRERSLRERGEQLEAAATERERELERRTSQLEFLHSLLRHDVQNGMMVIRSRAEFLAEALDGREGEYANTIVSRSEDISDQIDRMRTTLDTLTGEGRETERVDASRVLEERAEALGESAPDAEVDVDVAPGLAIEADEMLDDVFDNVLWNAVKHSDKDTPRVEVTGTAEDGTVRIEVADNGPGIAAEHRDTVFRRGVTTADADHESGSGFGLFFVDTMVDTYDGEVWIEDNDPEGARFVFEFPSADVQGSDS